MLPEFDIEFADYYGKGNGIDLTIAATYVPPATPPAAANSASLHVAATQTCAPGHLTAVFASPGQFFQTPAGFPIDLIANIVDDCGNPLASGGAATTTFSTGDPAVALTPWPDGTWRATWQPLSAQQALATVQLTAISPAIAAPAQATVSGNILTSSLVPVVLSNSIVDAAGQKSTTNTLAPGQIVTIYGQNLSSQSAPAPDGFPVTTLAGVQVLLEGTAIPIFYVSPTQINAVIPFGVPLRQSLQFTVQNGGVPSVPVTLTAITAIPGIFTTNQTGSGQGAIVDAPSGQVADSTNPAHQGDFISIYCTGWAP